MYDPTDKTAVTMQDMIDGLRRIGLQEGDLVQVHSSLSAFGYVEGGPDTVVDALLQVVGPEGTVMMPTFNHGHADVFDIKTTPSTNGAITEALRRRPEAHRSMHPTHPYAAIGSLAQALTHGHLEAGTFAADSPLGRLATWGGWVLLLGVGMGSNTAFHVGEVMARSRCLSPWGSTRRVLDHWGRVVEVSSGMWRDSRCPLETDRIEPLMRSRGLIRDDRIGAADIHLMRAADVIGSAFFLAQKICPTCPVRIRQPDREVT